MDLDAIVRSATTLLAAWSFGHQAPVAPGSAASGLSDGPVSSFRDLVAWSVRDRAYGRYRLVARRGRGRIHAIGVPERAEPFDVDLGPGPDGVPWAVYSRGGRVVGAPISPAGAERVIGPRGTSPAIWQRRIVFFRDRHQRGLELWTGWLNGTRYRRLTLPPIDPHYPDGPSLPEGIDLRGRTVAYAYAVRESPTPQAVRVRRVDRAGTRQVGGGIDGEECSDDVHSPQLDDTGIAWVETVLGPGVTCPAMRTTIHRYDLATHAEQHQDGLPRATTRIALTPGAITALAPRPRTASIWTREACRIHGSETGRGCRLTRLAPPAWAPGAR
jgi:hypothetical protein